MDGGSLCLEAPSRTRARARTGSRRACARLRTAWDVAFEPSPVGTPSTGLTVMRRDRRGGAAPSHSGASLRTDTSRAHGPSREFAPSVSSRGACPPPQWLSWGSSYHSASMSSIQGPPREPALPPGTGRLPSPSTVPARSDHPCEGPFARDVTPSPHRNTPSRGFCPARMGTGSPAPALLGFPRARCNARGRPLQGLVPRAEYLGALQRLLVASSGFPSRVLSSTMLAPVAGFAPRSVCRRPVPSSSVLLAPLPVGIGTRHPGVLRHGGVGVSVSGADPPGILTSRSRGFLSPNSEFSKSPVRGIQRVRLRSPQIGRAHV